MASYSMKESHRFDTLPSIHHKQHERNGVLDYTTTGSRGLSTVESSSSYGRSRYERSHSPSGLRRSLSPSGRIVRVRSISPPARRLSPSPIVDYSNTGMGMTNGEGTYGRSRYERRNLSPSAKVVRVRSISPPSRRLSPPPPPPPAVNSHYSRGQHTTLYQRPVSASYMGDNTRHHLVDNLQDQLRTYKDELAKKDSLITQLTSVDTPRIPRMDTATSHIDEIYSQERLASAAAAKSEVAGLSVRVETLQSQNRELQVQLDMREEKIRELNLHIETARESEAKHMSMSQSLRSKLSVYESQADTLEGAATRSEVAIQTLQRQTREQQERILELESRLRTHTEDRERSNQQTLIHERKYSELMTSLCSILNISSSHDGLLTRITDLVQENSLLRGKTDSMKEYMTNAELETKASRETIARLVSEADREQRNVSQVSLEMDSLRQGRETALIRQRELEREVELLKERLDASQRAWNATRVELEERETRFSRNEGQVREFELQHRTIDQSFRVFKEQMAALLSDSYVTVEPFEEQIRERMTHLVRSSSDRKANLELLESKVTSLTEHLNSQLGCQREAERRAQHVESGMMSMEDKLRRAEGELAAGDVLRDGLRFDKERYLKFIEEICIQLKMDPIAADMGMDGAAQAILARVHQVVQKEGDSLIDRKTHIYNLQRKIKALKEQMDSKDLHMDLLRKKVASLEERAVCRTEVEREKDEEFVKNRKLLKLVDKYKRELNETRMELRDLKARLLQSADIRSRTLEQERELESLESKVGQLEHMRQKQAHKIQGLKSELDDTVTRFGEKKDVAHHTVATLTSELKALKQALQEMTTRERQLLDLRQVMARMLGLDVNSLAVPDYEIISRLEKLILANQSNAATVVALDTAMTDVSDGFRVGYENASRHLATTRSRSPAKVTRSMGHTGKGILRARSMSPARRRDNRQY